MKIVDFRREHISQAAALALSCYEEERRHARALPKASALLDLEPFAENGLGAAALEGDALVGFLCAVSPFAHAFRSTDATGVFSPMGANGARPENREKIYAALYCHAARKWVKAGAVSHGICLYAHDQAAQTQFYQYGFGLRCMDAIRKTTPCPSVSLPGYTASELSPEECAAAYPLELALHRHYLESPFFMNRAPETMNQFQNSFSSGTDRCFVSRCQGELCAFLRLSPSGETCVAGGPDYRHITGAYCLPEHRRKGVFTALLEHASAVLYKEGIPLLGVDFESINPPASAFWNRHFTSYTCGVVRRIDEHILLA